MIDALPQHMDALQDQTPHRGYPTIFPVAMSSCGSSLDSPTNSLSQQSEQDAVSQLKQELERAQQRISQLQVEKMEVCKELERKEQLLEEAKHTEQKLNQQVEAARCQGGEAAAVSCKAVEELLQETKAHEAGLQWRQGGKDQDVLSLANSELAAERHHRRIMQEKLTALHNQLTSMLEAQIKTASPKKKSPRKQPEIHAEVGKEEDGMETEREEEEEDAAESQLYPFQDVEHGGSFLLDPELRSSAGLILPSMKGEVVYHTNAFAQLEEACEDMPLQGGDSLGSDEEDMWERDAAVHSQLLDLSHICSAGNTPRESTKENMARLSSGHIQSLTELLGIAKAVDMRLHGPNSNPWAHAPLTSRGRPVRPYKSMRDFAGINISNIVSNNTMLAAAQQLSARSWSAGEGFKTCAESGNGVQTPCSARSNTSSSDRSHEDGVAGSDASKSSASSEAAQDTRKDKADQEERRLLNLLPSPMGFHNGRPLAALAVFYSCLKWKTFQAGRAGLLEKIVQIINIMIDKHQGDNTMLAYWLTNTATLWHLLHKSIKPLGAGQRSSVTQLGKKQGGAGSAPAQFQVEATYPTLVFKQQLDAHVQKIFPLIYTNVKKQISAQLNTNNQNSDDSKGATGSLAWDTMLSAFDGLLKTLKQQFVPKGLTRALFKQLFRYMNVQQFNQLLLRRDCCCYSNGQCIKAGLARLDEWVRSAGADWVADATHDLDYIRQAVDFMALPGKAGRSLLEVSRLCPSLSINQLYRLATMFWDDAGSTGSVSADVLQQMKQQLVSGQSGSHAFLLDADTMLTVAVEDVLKLLSDKDFQLVQPAATQQRPAPQPMQEPRQLSHLQPVS